MPGVSNIVEGWAADASVSGPEPLVRALQSLFRAYQKTSIYPPGHPAVPEALGNAALEFDEALGSRGSIVICVARDHLTVEHDSLAEASGAIKSLALLLHDLDIAVLEIRRGLTIAELHAFVHTLGLARRDAIKGAALVRLLDEQEFDHLRVVPIDYEALTFADGARTGSSAEIRDEVWDNLSSMISDLTRVDASVHPEQLARRVNEEIQQQEGTGVGVLRTRIRRVSRTIETLAPERREEVRQRMAGFVAALTPDLRADLLRVDVKKPGDSITLMTELADVIPELDLMDALQDIDRAGARVPEQMLTLLNKLVRISHERPTLRAGLRDTLENWGISSTLLDVETPDLRSALREVFRSRAPVECNPKPYQALLDDLSRQELQATSIPLESRYRDPTDPVDTHLHAAEVAVQLLSKAGGEKYRASLLGYIDAAGDDLVEHKRFEAVRDAAIAARSYSLLKKQTAETKLAAEGFLNRFTDEDRIRKILQNACETATVPDPAISLLRLGSTTALDRTLDFLDRKHPFEVAKALSSFVIESGPEKIGELIRDRSGAGWPLLRPLFPVLRELAPTGAIPLLEGLMTHAESRVRREALLVLCEIDRKPGGVETHLRRGLGDADQRLVAVAVQRLVHQNTKRSVALLGEYLRGQLAGAPPSVSMGTGVARALSVTGDAGLEELCATLDSLRFSFRARSTSMAGGIAAVLACHASKPHVQACVRRWQRSPARLLSALFPTVFKRAGGGHP